MAKLVLVCLLSVFACIAGQRITTIQLDGVQYFISRMNPYSPELNYFLSYQYCRSLGLQLASFETQEKVESMTQYLKNAGFGKYDFWTSGNRLGTGMFLWMSTGLPFNATFDYFENSADALQAGIDQIDHNSNTSPQRTARDSSSGLERGCVLLKGPSLKWMPQDCSAVKDFICEQTRCYYYNYGSIPVSSAQGRPITTTTPAPAFVASTTPFPQLMSTYASIAKKVQLAQQQQPESSQNVPEVSEPSLASLKLDHERRRLEEEQEDEDVARSVNSNSDEPHDVDAHDDETDEHLEEHEDDETHLEHDSVNEEEQIEHDEEEDTGRDLTDNAEEHHDAESSDESPATSEMPSVELRLKQISQEVEKMTSAENANSNDNVDIGRQSFLSLSDLIRTLRPNDKQIPQIDSDYSNAMRVLGETSSLVGSDESRKFKDIDSPTVTRPLY